MTENYTFNKIEHFITLVSFIWWQEPNSLWGGYKREEALESLSVLTGFSLEDIEKIMKGV